VPADKLWLCVYRHWNQHIWCYSSIANYFINEEIFLFFVGSSSISSLLPNQLSNHQDRRNFIPQRRHWLINLIIFYPGITVKYWSLNQWLCSRKPIKKNLWMSIVKIKDASSYASYHGRNIWRCAGSNSETVHYLLWYQLIQKAKTFAWEDV